MAAAIASWPQAAGLKDPLNKDHNTVVTLAHCGSDILPPNQPYMFMSTAHSVLNPVTAVIRFSIDSCKRHTENGLE